MSTRDESLIGRQLDEYLIDIPLGAGGMARVYRALDTKLRRYVALKVIAPDFQTDSDYRARFEHEAQSIARLDHPNIVHIYRFGEASDLYYMAMQYIEGADVGWLIEDYRSSGELMPIRDIMRIVQDTGAALDYAHSRGIIHRDVKPSNIMVNEQGHAILTDFGLALLGDAGAQGQIFGSPYYIAPEQATSSANVVPQSDFYSLGVALFEMLTGELPFTGGQSVDIAARHITELPPPPSRYNEAIPAAVDQVILRALEKDPQQRYQSGAEMSAALQNAVAHWSGDNRPVPEGTRRVSKIRAPEKVSQLILSSPLPTPPQSFPERIPSAPIPAPEFIDPVLAQTVQRSAPSAEPAPAAYVPPVAPAPHTAYHTPAASQMQPVPPPPPYVNSQPVQRQRPAWTLPLILLGTLLAICLIGGLAALLAARGLTSIGVASRPTATNTAQPTITQLPTLTQLPTITLMPTPTSFIFQPTAAPTFTPMILQQPDGSAPQAGGQVGAQVPQSPPGDRNVPPSNSRRLGEFAVEWYCDQRGMRPAVVNNGADWACLEKSGGATVFTLQASDFDTICQSWYKNPQAFAIRDMRKETQAYNWSCYEWTQPAPQPVAPPVQQQPVAQQPDVSAVATPSVNTLLPRLGQDWVALVNISNTPVSLDGVEFRRDNRALRSKSWGRDMLQPGQCLRIYRGDQTPAQLPANCTTAIDYPADAGERAYWLDGKVNIAINPVTTYCYPSDQCQ
ncbi:MAG: serine/threonine protein kinase [Anaerolineae bacterium]|nr:serine/threonine protein kinase [Anaerolineae bacterium]